MSHISFLIMNKLNLTESDIFISLMYSVLPKALTIQNLFIFTAADVLRVAAVKCLPLHHHSADDIFWSFGITEVIFSHFENRVSLRPMLGGSVCVYVSGGC